MKELNQELKELRKEIIKKRLLAVGNATIGTVAVPLEILAHLFPPYWVYKYVTYDPRTRELETLDFFEDAKKQLKEAREAKEQVKVLKMK